MNLLSNGHIWAKRDLTIIVKVSENKILILNMNTIKGFFLMAGPKILVKNELIFFYIWFHSNAAIVWFRWCLQSADIIRIAPLTLKTSAVSTRRVTYSDYRVTTAHVRPININMTSSLFVAQIFLSTSVRANNDKVEIIKKLFTSSFYALISDLCRWITAVEYAGNLIFIRSCGWSFRLLTWHWVVNYNCIMWIKSDNIVTKI